MPLQLRRQMVLPMLKSLVPGTRQPTTGAKATKAGNPKNDLVG